MPHRSLALALLVLLVAGCAPVDAEASAPISVDVTQGRTDRDARVIVLDVTNTGTGPIELVSAGLETPQFTSPATWTRGTTLAAGRTVSLRAPLAEPVCPVPDGAEPRVSLTYIDGSGASHSVTVEPSQSNDVLAIIEKDDCIAALTAARADLRIADTVTWIAGAHQPVELVLTATPTGEGSLEVVEAQGTILLALVDPAGSRAEELPIARTIDGSTGVQQFALRLVPARCDPHAIAEDKRGTIMVLAVRLDDGTEGVAYVRPSDEVKASLYAFVTDYCAAEQPAL